MRAILGALAGTVVTVAGCLVFVDNPGATSSSSSGSGGGLPTADGGDDAGDAGDAGEMPALCVKYGGYGTVQKVVGDLVGVLVADCRVSTFFTTLTPARQQHLGDCLTKQVAVLMRCPGIKYDVDNSGVDCRDMKTSHHGLAIREDDFDALIDDVVSTLQTDGVAQADIDAMAPALLFLKNDIVTNSAPGLSKGDCVDGGGDGG